jgi:hypothetical protein
VIVIKTRISVTRDGRLSGSVAGLPPCDQEAEIVLSTGGRSAVPCDRGDLLARVRAIQAELAALPVRDNRNPDEIIGYNERGHFD